MIEKTTSRGEEKKILYDEKKEMARKIIRLSLDNGECELALKLARLARHAKRAKGNGSAPVWFECEALYGID